MSDPFPLMDFTDSDRRNECLSELIDLGDWIRFAASQMGHHEVFFGHGFDSAWDEAVFLCLRALHLDWDAPPQVMTGRLLPSERARLWSLIQQRCVERIPTAYLLQESWYFGEPFKVTPDVLIPRSPIAELIEARFAPWLETEPEMVLDLCTGSGCIGIATARVFPHAQVHLSDLSEAAVSLAIENIDSKDMGWQVSVFQGDLFDALEGQRYDLIVTNPPYVDLEDLESMPEEFHHEPRLGLAAGEDGLDIVRRILKEAPNYLTENGLLVCEVGNSAAALTEAYPDLPLEWPEFANGGHGVFIVTAQALREYNAV